MACPESATGLHLKHHLDKENEQAQNLIMDMNSESKLHKNTLKKKTAKSKAL